MEVEMFGHLLLRNLSQPLFRREVLELWCSKHFQHLHFSMSDVLDIVRIVLRYYSYVPSHVIERPGFPRRGENRHSRMTFEEEAPLISIRMPMHLPHAPFFDSHMRRRCRFRYWEIRGIGDSDSPAWELLGFLIKHAMGESEF